MVQPIQISNDVSLNPETDVDGAVYYSKNAMDVVNLLSPHFSVFSWEDIKKANNAFEYYNPFKGARVKYKVVTYNRHYAVHVESNLENVGKVIGGIETMFYPSYLHITNSNNDATFPFSVALNFPGGMITNGDYVDIQGTTVNAGFNNMFTFGEIVDVDGNPATGVYFDNSDSADTPVTLWLYHPTMTITKITAPENRNSDYEYQTDGGTGAVGITLKTQIVDR